MYNQSPEQHYITTVNHYSFIFSFIQSVITGSKEHV